MLYYVSFSAVSFINQAGVRDAHKNSQCYTLIDIAKTPMGWDVHSDDQHSQTLKKDRVSYVRFPIITVGCHP